MLTGRLNFLERGWGGMEPFDVCLPHLLAKEGIHSHIETDHYHYAQGGGEFYHTTFSTWQLHRGQEYDPIPTTIRPSDNLDPELVWNKDISSRNRSTFKREEDFPTPRTLKGAVDWLRINEASDNYLLWIEAFDPHGPLDFPRAYEGLYGEDFDKSFPISTLPSDCSPKSVDRWRRLRRQYASLLTMVDRSLSELMAEIDRQRGWDDTMIILTTDHGLMFGEHGLFGKNHCHVWNELASIPLLVHLPGSVNAGQRRKQLTQSIDIFSTTLDFFHVNIEHAVHGKSFLEAAKSNDPTLRNSALYGWYGKTINVTDGKYTYFRAPATRRNSPLYHYFLMPTEYHKRIDPNRLKKAELGYFLPYLDIPVLRVPGIPEFAISDEIYQTRLFNLETDPMQVHDLYGSKTEAMMIDLLIQALREHDSPPEQFDRVGLL